MAPKDIQSFGPAPPCFAQSIMKPELSKGFPTNSNSTGGHSDENSANRNASAFVDSFAFDSWISPKPVNDRFRDNGRIHSLAKHSGPERHCLSVEAGRCGQLLPGVS